MNAEAQYRVVEVERLGGGVLIAFESGEAAHYPAKLLYSVIDKASKIPLATASRPPTAKARREKP
jgi:hypothetical protein